MPSGMASTGADETNRVGTAGRVEAATGAGVSTGVLPASTAGGLVGALGVGAEAETVLELEVEPGAPFFAVPWAGLAAVCAGLAAGGGV